MVRAKFILNEVRAHSYGGDARTLVFTAQYDPTIEEDRRFAKATPTGRLEMYVDNPVALAHLELGRTYYLDFTATGGQ